MSFDIGEYMQTRKRRIYKVKAMLKGYDAIRRLCQLQYKFPEDTDRYNRTLAWYDLIHDALTTWDSLYPDKANIIRSYYGIYPKPKKNTIWLSMQYNYSQSGIYKIIREFVEDVARGVTSNMM